MEEAKRALMGLSGVHLYGRRLVVEPAASEQGLDTLRAKAGMDAAKQRALHG